MTGRPTLADARGFTLIELLVGIGSFVVLFGAIMAMTTVAVHNQDRISERVWANQRARPVLTRIIDTLHSSCVAQRVAPVQENSTASQIRFVSKSGSEVSPTPELHVISLSGGSLSESVYPATSGSAPTWSYSTTPSSTRTLLTQVAAPPGGVFSYFAYVNGTLSTTPLPFGTTGLSATDAARTVYVTVSLRVAPSRGVSTQDPNSPITLTDSADLRLQSASPQASAENLPCV